MKIISKGVDPATVPLRCTCSKCRTQIEFLPHEAKFRSNQREGDFYTITCPACQASITKDAGRAQPNYYQDH